MTLAWWQLAALALMVMVIGNLLVVANRNGWTYVTQRCRELWWSRPRPLAAWRSQDLWQRRRQTLIGLCVAALVSMLLAIALRGLFVPVFVMMLVLALLSVVFAMVRGAVELRRGPQTVAHQLAELGPDVDLRTGPYAETGIFADDDAVPKIQLGPVDSPPLSIDSDETPLMFQPLGIDPAPPPERSGPQASPEPPQGPLSEAGNVDQDENRPGSSAQPTDVRPSFSAAPEAGRYQASARARYRKRRTARPIYIESTLDDSAVDGELGGGTGKAVGDQ